MAVRKVADPILRITSVDHRSEDVARRLHAIRMLAYRQEAKLLGAIHFPPLERTVGDVRASSEEFCCACWDEEIVAALSTCPDREGGGVNVASLVVHPDFQRRGLGRALLSAAVAKHAGVELTVRTGAGNEAVLALYGLFGFREYRRLWVGSEPLELVELRRPAEATHRPT